MKQVLFASVLALGLGMIAGCSSSSTQDPGLVNPNNNTQGACEKNPNGICYPTDDVGTAKRLGTVSGNRIKNYKFVGYGTDASAVKLDTTKPTSTVSLADFFDPTGDKYLLIHITVAAVWCGPCNQETDEIATSLAAKYGPQKVVFLQALTEDGAYAPAKLTDLEGWISDHNNNFSTVLDPEQINLGVFFDKAAIPFNANIDARSMEILTAATGYGGMDQELTKWVGWTKNNCPKTQVRENGAVTDACVCPLDASTKLRPLPAANGVCAAP